MIDNAANEMDNSDESARAGLFPAGFAIDANAISQATAMAVAMRFLV